MPISGCIGPRGDGYTASTMMTAAEAMEYHRKQVQLFANSAADLISALTLNYANEAIGLIRAAKAHGIPIAVSFTVDTNGELPSGETLREAIERCDHETNGYTSYFMINCAHPTHFHKRVQDLGSWVKRIGGVRANASRLSHTELDNASELDRGSPDDLANEMLALKRLATEMNVFGGCCGTDHEHIAKIAEALRNHMTQFS
jgi:S-methylmethionine-dependent homocysteine/selenocysteine methylase